MLVVARTSSVVDLVVVVAPVGLVVVPSIWTPSNCSPGCFKRQRGEEGGHNSRGGSLAGSVGVADQGGDLQVVSLVALVGVAQEAFLEEILGILVQGGEAQLDLDRGRTCMGQVPRSASWVPADSLISVPRSEGHPT